MKYKIVTLALLAGSILSVSCNKDLDEKPVTNIDYREALKTSDDVLAALVGTYRDLGSADFYGGRVFMESDFLANTSAIDWYGTYQGLTQIYNKAIPVDDIFVTNVWLAGYKVINDANGVLDSLNLVTSSKKQTAEGEAKFIRGASYFQLVKVFAKAYNDGNPANNPGVPLVLKSTDVITDANKVKRNTVAEVYQQVIKDLTDAASKLPVTNGFFADKAAANAMLARVYLQMGDYQNALTAANNAITIVNQKHGGLVGSYADAFSALNTPEDIFAIQVTATSGTQGFNEFYSSSQRGEAVIDDAYLDTYDNADDRKNLFYKDGGSWYTGKFEELHGNVHIIRLAEMYLIRAECNFRLNSSLGDTPVNDVNKIRVRAQLPSIDAADLTLNEILNQRRLELDFEGLSLDDVKRLNKNVGLLAWNSPKLIFPIPKREILANSNLTQNEGY